MKKRLSTWWLLLLLIPAAVGLFRLRLDVEVLNLLPSELPSVRGLQLYRQYFSDSGEMMITLRGDEEEATLRAAQRIATRLGELTHLVARADWQSPWRENPSATAELLAYIWLHSEPGGFRAQLRRLEPNEAAKAFDRARERLATSFSPAEIARASYDPLHLLPTASNLPDLSGPDEMFQSPDGTFRILLVQAAQPLQNYRQCQEWVSAIRSAVTELVQREQLPIQTGFTGGPVFTAEISRSMKFDMQFSILCTSTLIALLFCLAHRRLKPMLWLLCLLFLILITTLGIGGLIFGSLNVIAIGFAAILLGLAVDYALLHYQEALQHPHLSIPRIRRTIAPAIAFAALTTILAFLVLNFAGLPGLAELGSLVALGVALSALVMVFGFLPPLFPDRWHDAPSPPAEISSGSPPPHHITPWASVLTFAAALAGLAIAGLPKIDPTAEPLRPINSQAYDSMAEIRSSLNNGGEPLWLLTSGKHELAVWKKLEQTEQILQSAVSNQVISRFVLPTALWPRSENLRYNLATLESSTSAFNDLRPVAAAHGFSPTSLSLLTNIQQTWRRAVEQGTSFTPTHPVSRWILDRTVVTTNRFFLAMGLVYPSPSQSTDSPGFSELRQHLAHSGALLSGWTLLGHDIYTLVRQNLVWLIVPVLVLILASLFLAFHNWREMLLSLAVLAGSCLILLVVMRLAGWSWNLMNLVAVPLILGTGVDYGIFTLLALKRYQGDTRAVHDAVGRALLLCGGTAIAGFGTLAFSSNLGMASLGKICATGIAANMLISVYLLPGWWQSFARPAQSSPNHTS